MRLPKSTTSRSAMMRATFPLLLALMIAVSGCAGADVMLLDPSRSYPPTQDVQLLLEEPSRPYEVIAIIEGQGSQYNNQSQVVRAAQRRAGRVGAHAIMPVSTQSQYVA